MTVTTTRASQKVTSARPYLKSAHSTGVKAELKTGHTQSRQNDEQTSSRHHVRNQSHDSHSAISAEHTSAGSLEGQARWKSSSGSSSNPTRSSSSGGESNHSVPSTQQTGKARAHGAMKRRSLSSELSHDSQLEQIIQSLPGSFPTSPRWRRKHRIAIAKPFTDFGVSNRKMESSVVQPQALHAFQSHPSTGLRKDSLSPRIVRLSPRSLRKARLKILEKRRSLSSSSSVLQLENDRRGSILLPRQHYCEPGIQGHHRAPEHQNLTARSNRDSIGSPDPDSPDGGNGSASSGHDQRRPPKPEFEIANMRIADILCLRTRESHCVEIIGTSRLRKLPLDVTTRASIEKIAKRRHGSTMVGVGPWVKVSHGERLAWNNWCCISVYPLMYLDNNGMLSDGMRKPQLSHDDITLVPLTDAQARLLRRALEESNSDSDS